MKTIKLGIFGLGRGSSFMESVLVNNGEVVALCDRDVKKMEKAAENLPEKPAFYTDFEAFIRHDMDAVFLANCFHEHASFAIRCLEAGFHVLSECTSNATMAEGVALVRAAEKSKGFYMLAENYPFMRFNQEMRRIYRSGTLGKALYAEGEYNHPFDMNDEETHKGLRPYPEHWRNFLPRSYYITHSLAPLMYMTGAVPKRVTAMACFAPFDEFDIVGTGVADRAAIITTLNDDDSVFRVTGCAAFGGHSNSYRICGTKGQAENHRGVKDKVMLRFNKWDIPEGMEEKNYYIPEWPADLKELIEKAGHGGGDFFVIKEFFDCIRENRQPEFDAYFATTCASVAILAHRSLLEQGVPYDIPDFHREEDRQKYENDTLLPLPRGGEAPNMPCCSRPDYQPDPQKYANYLKMVKQ
ncbi:MAG: Gfo/Idh/MocA family oxidoreductase [Clostridia bacterium]|nr:Gfo/Idh/MocA family oxidoreductase [Clostridia bacterium]MBQ8893188.1 Gfo/Idh/MocA family oxidoreductase [Clostridia bacterium]